MPITHVLHPTDFSATARVALGVAVRLALVHDATLVVYHAVVLHAEDPANEERQMEDCLTAARTEAGRVAQAAGGRVPPLKLESRIDRSVFVADAILSAATEIGADLIVLGMHGRSGAVRLIMGSQAEKVLRHASCAVVTVRADARVGDRLGFSHILVPVDFSDHSRRAVDAARTIATPMGSELTLLHVIAPIPEMYLAGGITSYTQLDRDLPARITARLREWAGDPSIETLVSEGATAVEIVRAAESAGCDLIVMGARGLTGLSHLLVGSVTERVCRTAHVPVLTSHPPA